ncbi:unnamed protein product [Effrenium voratum]|nr:unnamed protein product [Effrenium voratum]
MTLSVAASIGRLYVEDSFLLAPTGTVEPLSGRLDGDFSLRVQGSGPDLQAFVEKLRFSMSAPPKPYLAPRPLDQPETAIISYILSDTLGPQAAALRRHQVAGKVVNPQTDEPVAGVDVLLLAARTSHSRRCRHEATDTWHDYPGYTMLSGCDVELKGWGAGVVGFPLPPVLEGLTPLRCSLEWGERVRAASHWVGSPVIMSFQAQLNSVLAFEDGAESSLALLPGVGEDSGVQPDILVTLEEAGVRAPWQAALALQQVGGESGYRAQLRAIVLTALGPKLTPVSPPREGVKETASASTRKRKDTPISQQSNGGSLQKALRAAAPENREESLRNLERDVFARSNHQAMDARWTTWQKLSRQWELEPLPLTTAKIRAIASSLKAGGYKSLRAYFSRVRRQHVAQCGEAAPADVDLAIRDAVRSIERGIGGPALEDGFRFEQVTLSLDSKSATKKAAIFTLGVWFLLREIELAALQVKHVAVDEANTIVTISLSCSKMDTVGQSVHRSHKCYCSYVPETRRDHYEEMSKEETISIIREVLGASNIPLLRTSEALPPPSRAFKDHPEESADQPIFNLAAMQRSCPGRRSLALQALSAEPSSVSSGKDLGRRGRKYLSVRGIIKVGILASLASSQDELDDIVVKPLQNGFVIDSSNTIKFDQLRLPVEKDLPAGWWATQVAKFEGATVGGAKRRFPQQQLLAAEAILGRMVFEAKTETQTALGLHEIVQARFFNSAGEPNPLHKDRRKLKLPTTVVNADHQLQAEPETAWHPKSTLAFLDCLESIRWAWALTETGPEPAIDRMTEGFSRKVRVHSNKLEQLRSYWETISWKIALGLRSKEKFADIVDIVINNTDQRQAVLAWESDPDLANLTVQHFPHLEHRGNMDKDSPSQVIRRLRKLDPKSSATVIISAGPPCPDYSRIREAPGAQGVEGSKLVEGSKFVRFADFVDQLEKNRLYPQAILVVENVVPENKQDVRLFEQKL